MKDFVQRDEIDRLIDLVLAQPARAEEVKAVLRARLSGAPTLRLVAAPDAEPEADDDTWDNVPI
ncbi:hypothetical protein [Tranquillimonas alkanivorans]|uniref:Uncharacterized protein n=1 Tax=Tranquillimonas alkanivorans TaxID=441119 RepID=A0A1I5SQK6_9RHOB|nr:hypothetical protein [Tranquillimonas alkanivorans]SFP72797.1 hypothetical protein SAMN04488047_111135 [Tranquillimonas alkanivorans]